MQPHPFRPALAGLSLLAACTVDAAPPNIVLILADDLGYGDVGCFGQREIATPHLDRLASEGMRFTHAYAGSTVCAPSRCALLTGRHTGHCTVRGNPRPGMQSGYYLASGDVTIATVLRDAGYATGAVGKWGLGQPGVEASGIPSKQGFDTFFGYLHQTHAHNSYPSHLYRNTTRVDLPNTVPDERPNGSGVSDNKLVFSQDLFIEEALGFIRSNRARPFFLYFAPTLPHANNESRPFGLEIPNTGLYSGRDWPPARKTFAAMVSRLDHDIGRIMALLRDLQLDRNTLVVFTSDNGPHMEAGGDPAMFNSSGPFQGHKRSLHEGGIRVPTIAWWPGRVAAGAINESPWYGPDLFPTLAAAAGEAAKARVPTGLDGVDVLPTFLGDRQPELDQRLLYWEFHEGGFACAARQGHWKAIRKSPSAALEIYDLAIDPGETNNLAAAQPEVAARFEAALRAARTDSPDWPVAAGR